VRYCEGLEVDEEGFGQVEGTDHVLFDNQGGGRQVTQYLLRQGHRRIAYMGLHAESESRGPFAWSRMRCAGWQESLIKAGQSPDRLEFLPSAMPGYLSIQEQLEASVVVAERLVPALRRDEISAVVTVNPHAAQALFSVLQEAKILADRWPVITTFGMGDARVAMMTSMLLSYEQLGREAADLLWSRAHGGYDGPSRGVAVPMKLITRLTCRPAWKARPEAAVLSAMAGNLA
jgi:DNA-binding LacI/PurR family transcriptional regulator